MTTETEGPRRAVIYCRISSDREGREYGVDRQEVACRKLAERRGWTVVKVLVDNDITGTGRKRRPGYVALLDMLREGSANAILAVSDKRLNRNYQAAFDLLDLLQSRDIAVEYTKGGAVNLNTAEGRGTARRKAVDAQEESEEISERVIDAKQDNLRDGTYRGGPRPFGYEADGVTVREEEARHVRAATAAVIAGDSLRSVCRDWAALGVRTVARRTRLEDGTRTEPVSRAWRPEELRKMLLRARNAGLIETKGEVVGKAVWPPLVTEETWRACVAVLADPSRRTTPGNARRWLGSGLFRCGQEGCPETVRCSTVGRAAGRLHVPAYRCRTGKHVTRTADMVDEYVGRVVVARLSRPDAVDLLAPATDGGVAREHLAVTAANLRAKLAGYTEDYDDDRITRQQMLAGTARTRERLAVVEQQMAGRATGSILATLPLGTTDMSAAWKRANLDRKRAIVDVLMTVTILPAKRGRPKGFVPGSGTGYFDPERIRIDWNKNPAGTNSARMPREPGNSY